MPNNTQILAECQIKASALQTKDTTGITKWQAICNAFLEIFPDYKESKNKNEQDEQDKYFLHFIHLNEFFIRQQLVKLDNEEIKLQWKINPLYFVNKGGYDSKGSEPSQLDYWLMYLNADFALRKIAIETKDAIENKYLKFDFKNQTKFPSLSERVFFEQMILLDLCTCPSIYSLSQVIDPELPIFKDLVLDVGLSMKILMDLCYEDKVDAFLYMHDGGTSAIHSSLYKFAQKIGTVERLQSIKTVPLLKEIEINPITKLSLKEFRVLIGLKEENTSNETPQEIVPPKERLITMVDFTSMHPETKLAEKDKTSELPTRLTENTITSAEEAFATLDKIELNAIENQFEDKPVKTTSIIEALSFENLNKTIEDFEKSVKESEVKEMREAEQAIEAMLKPKLVDPILKSQRKASKTDVESIIKNQQALFEKVAPKQDQSNPYFSDFEPSLAKDLHAAGVIKKKVMDAENAAKFFETFRDKSINEHILDFTSENLELIEKVQALMQLSYGDEKKLSTKALNNIVAATLTFTALFNQEEMYSSLKKNTQKHCIYCGYLFDNAFAKAVDTCKDCSTLKKDKLKARLRTRFEGMEYEDSEEMDEEHEDAASYSTRIKPAFKIGQLLERKKRYI